MDTRANIHMSSLYLFDLYRINPYREQNLDSILEHEFRHYQDRNFFHTVFYPLMEQIEERSSVKNLSPETTWLNYLVRCRTEGFGDFYPFWSSLETQPSFQRLSFNQRLSRFFHQVKSQAEVVGKTIQCQTKKSTLLSLHIS